MSEMERKNYEFLTSKYFEHFLDFDEFCQIQI